MTKINTLLVEDDEFWATEIIKSLNNQKFEVFHVDNISTAKIELEKQKFDLIILDLILPDSNSAITTITTFAPIASQIPIIITSTISSSNIISYALTHGIQDFIIKSQFTEEVLVHSALLAVQRLTSKLQNKPNDIIVKIIENLKLIEFKLLSANDNLIISST